MGKVSKMRRRVEYLKRKVASAKAEIAHIGKRKDEIVNDLAIEKFYRSSSYESPSSFDVSLEVGETLDAEVEKRYAVVRSMTDEERWPLIVNYIREELLPEWRKGVDALQSRYLEFLASSPSADDPRFDEIHADAKMRSALTPEELTVVCETIEDESRRLSVAKDIATQTAPEHREQAARQCASDRDELLKLIAEFETAKQRELGQRAADDRAQGIIRSDTDQLRLLLLERVYENPQGYCSYRQPINALSDAVTARVQPAQIRAMLAAHNGARISVGGSLVRRDTLKFFVEQYICGLAAASNDWPLYWVGPEMLIAAMASDVPHDVTLDELKWPREAMIFMLPRGAWKSGDGHFEFLVITKHTENIAAMDATFAKRTGTPELTKDYAGFLFCYAYHSSGFVNISTYKLSGRAADINLRTLDALDLDRNAYEKSGIDFEGAGDLTTQLITAAINLMLIMQARRELITGGEHIKRLRAKKGETPRDLWSPRWIGRDYHIQRERPSGETGTHASPRLHWRRGHFRNQAWGPRLTMRRMMWIDPMLVSAKAAEPRPKKASPTASSEPAVTTEVASL